MCIAIRKMYGVYFTVASDAEIPLLLLQGWISDRWFFGRATKVVELNELTKQLYEM
jgi:hypothetical protein